jgi:branched-subunit amino acid aminotransferase/4-amino-4-deoxychorismate lyase
VHAVIYLNKTMVEATKARLAPVSSALLYGRGVFTTLSVQRGDAFLWSRHWQRLVDHANKLSIDLTGMSETSVGEAVRKLIAVNKVNQGLARVVLLARDLRDIWLTKSPNGRKTDLMIMTSDQPGVRRSGLSLAISPFRLNTSSSLQGVKSLNYLSHLLPWEEAQERDFSEAIMLNERGEIVSATMANIFWVKDGTVQTPTLSSGAIAGITREAVLELSAKHFIPVVEGVYEIADLTDADEIFLTSSSLGVGIVTTFDFRSYAIAAGSVASRLAEIYREFTLEV